MKVADIFVACVRHVSSALRQLDAAVMPLRCVFCGTRSRSPEQRICSGCHEDLPWLGSACALCAEPMSVDVPADVHCPACQEQPPPFVATVAPLLYEFPVDAGLKALKFRRRLHYAPAFAELLVATMPRFDADVDALLPVPLHWRRQAFRGFNQATELTKPLARHCGLPILKGATRRRATPFQSALTAKERSKNLARAFTVRNTAGSRHVLIVDDVVTTGATTRQLAATLIASGVEKVSVLAVARAV